MRAGSSTGDARSRTSCGPRTRPCARSRSRASASASAFGLTVMIAFSRCSYVAMRARYCVTISRDVVRRCSSAFRMSSMLASTTVKGLADRAGVCAASADGATAADTASRAMTMSLTRPSLTEFGARKGIARPTRCHSERIEESLLSLPGGQGSLAALRCARDDNWRFVATAWSGGRSAQPSAVSQQRCARCVSP